MDSSIIQPIISNPKLIPRAFEGQAASQVISDKSCYDYESSNGGWEKSTYFYTG